MTPIANPRASYVEHRDEINEAIHNVLESGSYILGDQVRLFENNFAKYIGVKYCVGVASGTDALFLSMKALGIGKGDEVITVSHTAVATVSSIVMTGATPVLIDIEPETFTMDTFKIKSAITKNTKAIIPVHLYGNPCSMFQILDIALKYSIAVIEDCAQSTGAIYRYNRNEKSVGSIGNLGCFSFYPTKNLGCFGDGGAITTDSKKLYDKLLLLRQYGWKKRYISEIHGYNSRLDEIQAAVLNVKLKYLDEDNKKRQQIAINRGESSSNSVYHLHVVREKNRAKVMTKMLKEGVQTAIHYPVPIHLQPGYKHLVRVSGTMVETERAAKEVMSLPMYPQL